MTAARSCPRCGSPLRSLEELVELARAVAGEAAQAAEGWHRMRLAIPQVLLHAMRDLERDAPRLAAGLACHAGTCVRERS